MAGRGDNPILVFLGPTVRLSEAEKVLDAIYLQPAAQGMSCLRHMPFALGP